MYAGVTHIDVADLPDEKITKIKKVLEKSRIQISSLGYYANLLAPDEKSRHYFVNHLKKVIDAANKLEIGIVGTFIGRDMYKTVEDNISIFQQVWPDIVRYAEDHNIRLAIENCPMQYPEHSSWPGGTNIAFSPTIWRKIFEIIPSKNLGLNYDPSHLYWQGIDYVRPIREFKDRIFHTHAKDTKLEENILKEVGILGYYWHLDRLPGLGDIDWRKYIAALHEIGYTGVVSIEHEDRNWESSVEKKKEGLLFSKKYLKHFM